MPSIRLCLILCLLIADAAVFVSAGRNYYDVLGVPKDAHKRQIKKAFRKLSMEKHPDKSDSPNAEEEFAEISNAYQVLSDDEARKKYDRFGEEGLKSGSGGGGFQFRNHHDIFNQFFGGGGGGGFQGGFPGGGFGNIKFNFGGNGGGGRQPPKQPQPKKEKLYTPETPDIEILTVDNFDSIALSNDNDIWLIQFYQEGCKHCHDLGDAYKKAATDLRGQVRMGVIDTKNEGALAQRFAISGTPTIILLPYGSTGGDKVDKAITYKGPRNAKAITNFAVQKIPSFVTEITSENVQSFLEGAKTKVVLLFTERRVVPPMFSSLSKDFNGVLDFGAITKEHTASVAQRFEVVKQFPALLLLDRSHGANAPEELYSGAVTYMEIRRWLFSHYKSLRRSSKVSSQAEIISLNPSTEEEVCGKKLCIITAYEGQSSPSSLQDLQGKLLSKYAQDNKFIITELSSNVYRQFWESFGEEGTHTMIVWNRKRGKYVLYSGEMHLDNVVSFLDNLLGGNLRWKRFAKGTGPTWGGDHEEL